MANTPNVYEQQFEYDDTDPPGYRAGVTRIGGAAGGKDTVIKEFEIPPGETLCPYHYEYEEEWLVVLDGTVALRTPAGEQELSRGEIVCFAPGPDGAHKVTNRGHEPARIMMFSSAREPAVAVYPDSGKIGVWPGNSVDDVMLRRADGRVDYWDGER
jgi:uncharacterized cupin superfamily protein